MKKIFTLLLLIVSYMGFAQATLPVSTTTISKTTLPTGFSHLGLGTDYTGPKLKFDTTGDYLVLYFDSAPANLTFSIGENNSFTTTSTFVAGSEFTIEESSDGNSYSPVVKYTSADNYGDKTITSLKSTSRYVRWFFTTKVSGSNVTLYNIALAKASTPGIPSLSLSKSSINFGNVFTSATSAASTVTVTGSDLTSTPTYTITGTDAAMFSAIGTLTTSGGSLDVTFSPTSVGEKNATLTITSGSASSSVSLTGTGVTTDNPFGLVETSPVSALVENFETGVVGSTVMPNNWKTASEATTDKNWSIKTYNSNKYAEMTAYTGTGAYNTWLISPAINLDQINKTNVKFDWNSGYANGAVLKVYVLKLNSGVMVKNLVTTINDNVNTTAYGATFNTETLDLSAYSGVGFLAFEYVGNSTIPTTTTYQVDNINVSSNLAVKDLNKTKINLVKNTIVKDILTFGAKANVQFVNMNGQVVKSAAVENGTTLDVSSLAKGIYVIKGNVNGENVSQKIVKQ